MHDDRIYIIHAIHYQNRDIALVSRIALCIKEKPTNPSKFIPSPQPLLNHIRKRPRHLNLLLDLNIPSTNADYTTTLSPRLISFRFSPAIISRGCRGGEKRRAHLPVERNLGRQARNLISILGEHISQHRVLARWDLSGQIDVLCQAHLAFFEGALEVAFLDGFASVGVLVDERDEPVFDLEVHFEAFGDFLLEVS
jgi:hypothetical protein